MKNIDKHNDLDESLVRDFLAKQIGFGYDGEIAHIEQKIADAQEELAKAKSSQGARDLIDSKGWKWFDVSDEVEDYKRGEYFSFVGTEAELHQVFPELRDDK